MKKINIQTLITILNSTNTYYQFIPQPPEEIIDDERKIEEYISNFLTHIIQNYKNIYFTSKNTGEILYTLELNDHNIPNITQITKNEPLLATTGEEDSFYASSFEDRISEQLREIKKDIEDLKYRFRDRVRFTAFTCTGIGQTYKKGGIVVHYSPFADTFWRAAPSYSKATAEFRNENGEVTDRFFGVNNDFNRYFTARAAKSKKFDVYVFCEEDKKMIKATDIKCLIGEDILTLTQNRSGAWEIATDNPF